MVLLQLPGTSEGYLDQAFYSQPTQGGLPLQSRDASMLFLDEEISVIE